MTRDDKRPRQPRMTDGEREKARRAKRRAERQADHRLTIAADPEKMAEEREQAAFRSLGGGKGRKAALRGRKRQNKKQARE